MFQLTTSCNSNCTFCMNGGPKEGESVNPVKYKRALKKLVLENNEGVFVETVAFTGGEPLTRRDLLFDLAQFNDSLGLQTMLITNGTLVTPVIARGLFDKGVKLARVSLDTHNSEAYRRLRGVDAFDSAVEGIATLKASGMRVIVRTTVSKQNLSDLQKTYRLACNLGVDEVQLRVVSPYGRASYQRVPSNDELRRAFERVLSLKGTAKITTPCFFFGDCTDAKIPNRMKSCPCAREWIYVNSRGEMFPCNYFPKTACIGNFYYADVSKLWQENMLLNGIRSSRPPKCKSCGKWANCLNQCQALSYSLSGSFNTTTYDALSDRFGR
ncbi:MAG: radical SAM protein [Candidatus Micrarchaeia archaeon]